MPSHKALPPTEMLSTVQGLASITYAQSSTNENRYTENTNVTQGPQREREGEEQSDDTYARSKASRSAQQEASPASQWGALPDYLAGRGPLRAQWATFAAARENPLPLWSLTTTQGQHTMPDL